DEIIEKNRQTVQLLQGKIQEESERVNLEYGALFNQVCDLEGKLDSVQDTLNGKGDRDNVEALDTKVEDVMNLQGTVKALEERLSIVEKEQILYSMQQDTAAAALARGFGSGSEETSGERTGSGSGSEETGGERT